MRRAGRDPEAFRRLGLLLDTEADLAEEEGEGEEDGGPRALIQIFTKPLFNEDTFFLEVRRIQKFLKMGNLPLLRI